MKLTYDQRQIAAVLKACTVCGVEVYSTQTTLPFICICCQRDQERAT